MSSRDKDILREQRVISVRIGKIDDTLHNTCMNPRAKFTDAYHVALRNQVQASRNKHKKLI